ncbi:MAG: protease SohB [Gammaproteobacteria bacterium]|nr:protease SohB [Gammaproteobacteria bacterium]HBW82847.1 protease SohB [Gammaproteobacteria bacterium]
MEFLSEYGMFVAKSMTIVIAIVLIISMVSASGGRGKRFMKKGTVRVSKLNEHFEELRDSLREVVLDKDSLKSLQSNERKQAKAERKELKAARKKQFNEGSGGAAVARTRKRVYVINFKGNIAADAVACLREEISAILSLATPEDEVLVRLESPGGMVHAYGLASSQLARLKHAGTTLTICVDKVAASGGYMMACLADRLIAAPFAIIGSIGVLVQLPNFHRVLKKHEVDYEIISAGEYKRTLTTFGEITKKGKDKVREDVETIHGIFKSWVKEHRPNVDIDNIATGETWLGSQAIERSMVDEIRTSDECILAACETSDVFEVEYEFPKSIQEKLGSVFGNALEKAFSQIVNQPYNDRFQ